MTLAADKLERLIFVKFLLSQAERQKELDRPISSTAILTMHDLVECFLQLGLEHLAQKSKLSGNNILDTYSEELNKILVSKGLETINKSFIKRLNELRNQLKHATIFIDRKNIQNLYAETEIFVSDFIETFFNLSLVEISIITLITNDKLRELLFESERQLANQEFHLAIINIGKAFYEYEQIATAVKDKNGRNILRPYPSSVNYIRASGSSLKGSELTPPVRKSLTEVSKDMNEIKKEILSIKKIQLLHVDIRKYMVFRDIMPRILEVIAQENGESVLKVFIPEEERLTRDQYSAEQVKFCFDFVVETVFNYQNKAYA